MAQLSMKRINLRLIYLMLFLFIASFTLKAQQDVNQPAAEKVYLFCDRALFITGEEVNFSAFIATDHVKKKDLSLILYTEIISPDGRNIAGGKFPVINFAAGGCLSIPDDIITGIYYLRAYTKYMRNQGPETYSYIALKIVNPLRSDVMPGSDSAGTLKTQLNNSYLDDRFVITLDKKEYAPREVVNVFVKATGQEKNLGFCITVVPEASSSTNMLKLPAVVHPLTPLRYYTESRGVSITGELKDNITGKPVAGSRVNLSIIGKGRDFMAMLTDSAGRYFFSLPAYTGYRDLFLCAENKADSRPKILVDNDFCAIPVHLPSPVFKLTTDERKAAYNMATNAQIEKIFIPDTIPCTNNDDRADRAFYGEPTEILTIDNYVQLPTLEEYFNELPSAVKVRKRHGEKYFKVIGTSAEMAIFDPLVLLDWVAIDDPSKILAVSPPNIARIEIVNSPYVKGDITYGGVVSIISKQGDFAGIDLPASGIFLNYLFTADNRICKVSGSKSESIPDARNTVFWEPNLILGTGNVAHSSFTTPDTPGRYSIVLKGISGNGSTFTQTEVFEVKSLK